MGTTGQVSKLWVQGEYLVRVKMCSQGSQDGWLVNVGFSDLLVVGLGLSLQVRFCYSFAFICFNFQLVS